MSFLEAFRTESLRAFGRNDQVAAFLQNVQRGDHALHRLVVGLVQWIPCGIGNDSTESSSKFSGGKQSVEVSLKDGLKAVLMGLAAHRSIETGEAIDLTRGEYQIA